MSKYHPLLQHLATSGALFMNLSFAEIEIILDAPLPPSARRYSAWWGNNEGVRHVQAESWMNAGYHTENLNLNAQTVSFRKIG